MAESKGYTGKIANSGAQKVDAPVAVKAPKGKSTVKRGEDLRAKK